MEAAHQTAVRLRSGSVPPQFPVGVDEARDVGNVCYTWRNYLALGSLGPDLFYLLPDFSDDFGSVLRRVVRWVLDTWDLVDAEFVSRWERWIGPTAADSQQLASQLTGGLSNQLSQVMDELTQSIVRALEGLLPHLGDWFGLLTSGVPQGFGNNAFYWSDIFHYRRTYQFPFALFDQARSARAAATTDADRADAEAQMAFAVGWMTHCATDVTGHPFTNAKSGGPYRDHWHRHHLVENHLDSDNYSDRHHGPCYAEYGTSALHFWIAFRARGDGPYAGREDAPAYDYFTDFPAYDASDTPTAAAQRRAMFDLDTGDLPQHLLDAVAQAMADVHPDGPKILTQDPQFSMPDPAGSPDGRPNAEAMSQMWALVYGYLKLIGKDGLSPNAPTPPAVFTDHSFPTPPGGDFGVSDDPARGADVDDDDFNLLDLLLAIFAWAAYVAEVAVWLVTVLPGLILDVTTFPAREVIHYAVVVPLWNLYLLARRSLVMAGFLMPKPAEIDPGLTTLGVSHGTYDVGSALDDPQAQGRPRSQATEPSGRATTHATSSLDPAYPRNIVRDHPSDAVGFGHELHYAGDGAATFRPSEWVAPWRYPLKNQAGDWVPREGAPVHVGPYVVGDNGTVLLGPATGNDAARERLEQCDTPEDTFQALSTHLPDDAHLGAPIDYGIYLVGRMLAQTGGEFAIPDFNLDSDRGYAWHCWDWDRHSVDRDPSHPNDPGFHECATGFTPTPQASFTFAQPCTPPQMFDPAKAYATQTASGLPHATDVYDLGHDLNGHYLGREAAPSAEQTPDTCQDPGPEQPPFLGQEWPHVPLGGER